MLRVQFASVLVFILSTKRCSGFSLSGLWCSYVPSTAWYSLYVGFKPLNLGKGSISMKDLRFIHLYLCLWGFPGGTVVKNLPASAGDRDSGSEVAQSCPTLCDPMDSIQPSSSIHGIFQARILEWAAVSFSSRPSQPRVRTRVSCIADRRFTVWATREALPVQERQVQSLGQEDPLEKKMATHFSILEGRIPWTEEPGGLSPWGHKRVRDDWAAKQQICTYILGKGFVINLKDH